VAHVTGMPRCGQAAQASLARVEAPPPWPAPIA
jgi:hypothetical protein